MVRYQAVIDVAATPEDAFGAWVDAGRFPQWQAMVLRAFEATGPLDVPGSSVRLDHGPRMKRTLTVLGADPPHSVRFRQEGVGQTDETTAHFEALAGGGTRVTLDLDVQLGLGSVGRMLERLARGKAIKELDRELARFRDVVERTTTVTGPGEILSVDSGAGFRVVKVLAVDPDVVHVALLPGAAKQRPTDPEPHLDGESRMADPLALRPLQPPIRGAGLVATGQPLLRLDGGIGVPHLALTPGAIRDARPESMDGRSTFGMGNGRKSRVGVHQTVPYSGAMSMRVSRP